MPCLRSFGVHPETDGGVVWLAVVRQPAIIWLVWMLILMEVGEVVGEDR